MDYLQHCLNSSRLTYCKRANMIMFSSIIRSDCKGERVNHAQIQHVLDVVRQTRETIKQIWALPEEECSNTQKAILSYDVKQEAVEYVGGIKFSMATMRKLLLAIEAPENADLFRTIFYTLFSAPNSSFFAALKESRTHMDFVEQDPSGGMDIYGLKFAKFPAQTRSK